MTQPKKSKVTSVTFVTFVTFWNGKAMNLTEMERIYNQLLAGGVELKILVGGRIGVFPEVNEATLKIIKENRESFSSIVHYRQGWEKVFPFSCCHPFWRKNGEFKVVYCEKRGS